MRAATPLPQAPELPRVWEERNKQLLSVCKTLTEVMDEIGKLRAKLSDARDIVQAYHSVEHATAVALVSDGLGVVAYDYRDVVNRLLATWVGMCEDGPQDLAAKPARI